MVKSHLHEFQLEITQVQTFCGKIGLGTDRIIIALLSLQVLRCLVQCSESLQLPATALLEPGMEMVTNSHGTQVMLEWILSYH